MKCANCGAEIKTGSVYCPECGKEARVIDDIEILEDDLLRAMLEGEEEAEKEKLAAGSKGKDQKTKKRRRKTRRNIIIIIVIIAAIAAALFAGINYKNNHSTDYLLTKAKEAYSINDYQTALSYIEKLLEIDGDNTEALYLKGSICYDRKDTDTAQEALIYVISIDPEYADAYSLLLKIYDSLGDYDSIVSLKDEVTDSEILDLFEDYILNAPEVDIPGGSYNDYLEITVTASENAAYIYYTLDGTDPTEDSYLYETSIEIDEEGETTLKLICADENGNLSEITEEVYEINLEAPDMPTASPEGGTFISKTYVTVTVPEGCSVYYTWDNTDPTQSSSLYTGSIEVIEGNNVLSLIAIDSNGLESQIQRYNFVYMPDDAG